MDIMWLNLQILPQVTTILPQLTMALVKLNNPASQPNILMTENVVLIWISIFLVMSTENTGA